MINDKNIIDNLKLLDKILEILVRDCESYDITFSDLYFKIYNRVLPNDLDLFATGFFRMIVDKPFEDLDEMFNEPKSENRKAEFIKLIEACYYLKSENMIRIANDNLLIHITYFGILKHSKSFVKEYEKLLSDETRLINVETFQNKMSCWMMFLTGLIALGTLVAMIYYIFEIFSRHVDFCT